MLVSTGNSVLAPIVTASVIAAGLLVILIIQRQRRLKQIKGALVAAQSHDHRHIIGQLDKVIRSRFQVPLPKIEVLPVGSVVVPETLEVDE